MALSNSISVSITGNASSLKAALKESESSLAGFKNTASKIGGGIASGAKELASKAFTAIKAGTVAGTAAVVAMGKAAFSSYADWEQLIGGVETLFKESSGIVDEYAQQAYETAGLSANAYMETITSFSASLLQSLGNDTAKAADYGNQAVIDMSDNANKMGTDIARIQDAYQGFAKQNYTMLDNLKLGYGGTKTEMERLLADASKLAGIKFNIDSFADVTQAIHVIQEAMGIAGTTAKEGEATISGSLNQVKASWKNLITFMGGGTSMAWSDVFQAFVQSVKTFAKNVMPVFSDIVSGIASLFKELAPMVIEAIPAFLDEVLPGLIETVSVIVETIFRTLPSIIASLFNALIDIIPTLVEMIANLIPDLISGLLSLVPLIQQGIITLVRAILPLIPSILQQLLDGIIDFILTLTRPEYMSFILNAAIDLLMKIVEALPTVIAALIEALPDVITNIVEFLLAPDNIMKIIKAAVELFFGIVKAVPQILGALIGAFGQLVGNLWDWITSRFGKFANDFGNFIGGIFKGAINGVLQFIENFINAPINLINGFIGLINDAFGWIGVNIGKIGLVRLPRLETGGVIGGTSYSGDQVLARVNSGEMVINRQQQAALWNFIENGSQGGGVGIGDINVTVNTTATDPEAIGEATAVATVKAIRQAFISQGLKPELSNAGVLR